MHIRSLLCERIEAAFSRLGLEGHALLQAQAARNSATTKPMALWQRLNAPAEIPKR